ncbi:MAG: LuxR C-terminal-related transcriptional regulator [Anaerolineales bacterium]
MFDYEKAIVKDGFLKTSSNSIPIGSNLWFEWLSKAKKFSFKYPNGAFVAQQEIRRNTSYWYAYKRRNGKLYKAYLGKTTELTLERLQQIGNFLRGDGASENPPLSAISNDPHLYESRIDSSFLPITKITVPVLPRQLVSRERLNKKINTPLTLIHAPSGFGKSTLLNDWKQACGYPIAWLTLDEHDNNPARFLYSVVTALQTIHSDFGADLLTYISSATSINPTEAVNHLIKGILEIQAFSPHLGIVLDDFHRINHSIIYDTLQVWLERFPSNLQLVISGHTRPPLSLGHLRAQGMATELDVNDLRFTNTEGVKYLQQYVQEPTLAYDDLEKLVKHTEGWAAGLTLTALALSKQSDQRQFIDTFSGAHIYMREYFMETVLQRSNSEIQSFLLKTAILKNLTGSLCNAVTERTNSDEILEHLWQENLFIVRLEEQGWYRYHDLFAEMLYSQLQARYPTEVLHLHQRAAQWYREQYAPADAIFHLLSIEAWEEAATLIEEMALRELEQFGEDSRLLRWLQDLPENVVQKHKNLLFVYMRLANNALSQKNIELFINHIERIISNKPEILRTPDEKDVLAEIQEIKHTWAQGNTFVPPARSENDYDARWDLLNGLFLLKPAYSQCQEYAEEPIINLLNAAQEQNNLFVTLMTVGSLAKRFVFAGQLRRAEKMCKQALEKALAQRGRLPETASIALNILGHINFERNEMDLAQKYLSQSLDTDPNPTSSNMPIQNAILRSKIQIKLKQFDEALATIQTARNLHVRRPAGVWSSEDLLSYEIYVHLRNNKLDKAEELLREGPAGTGHHFMQQMRAEFLLKNGYFEEAEEILWNVIDTFPTLIMIEPLQEVRILLSLALFWQNKVNQSVQVMTGALRLSAPEKFIRPFLDWGKECAPILLLVSETQSLNGEAQEFLSKLLKILAVTSEKNNPLKEDMEKLSTSASISIREQEILLLLSEGYSNREMSKKLSVSESTVKTHLANIYTKLKVNSRMQAVSRAKQLKLVP